MAEFTSDSEDWEKVVEFLCRVGGGGSEVKETLLNGLREANGKDPIALGNTTLHSKSTLKDTELANLLNAFPSA